MCTFTSTMTPKALLHEMRLRFLKCYNDQLLLLFDFEAPVFYGFILLNWADNSQTSCSRLFARTSITLTSDRFRTASVNGNDRAVIVARIGTSVSNALV